MRRSARSPSPPRPVTAFLVSLMALGVASCGGGGGSNGLDAWTDVPPADLTGDLGPADVPGDLPGDRGPDAPTDLPPADVPDLPGDLSPEPGPDTSPADVPDADDLPAPADATDAPDAPDCVPQEPFDYTCEATIPATCPQGLCVLGMCLAPHMDPWRWADCGDGVCGPCQSATGCPADCAPLPTFTGAKEYDNDTTLTVWLHGFSNKSPGDMKTEVYGRDRGCGGLLEEMAGFGVARPCSDDPGGALAPNHLSKVGYYGGVPAEWMTPADVAEIEQYPYDDGHALRRYALIAAKFIRWKLATTGATHVNIACHSMGCYVARHLIENDLEGLASENRIVRWFTSSGVIAGARLARLYDNPDVQSTADAIGLLLADFVIMNPDFAQDWTAAWDHRLWEGNSPFLKGTLIHHVCGTDPVLREALNIPLLDLYNPGDEPNDGIMFTEDEYFHRQSASGGVRTPSGLWVGASHSLVREYHMQVPETPTAYMLGAATLFHRRRVTIRLEDVLLYQDRESHGLFDGENGPPPAEVTWKVEVRYDPYVKTTFGRDVLADDQRPEHRSSPLWKQNVNTTSHPNLVVFEGPLFDAMDSLRLSFELLEADWYPRFNVKEWQFDVHQALAAFDGQVSLDDHTFDVDSEYAHLRFSVKVLDLY